jgi:hypothetical protein
LPIIPNFPALAAPILQQYGVVSPPEEFGALARRARKHGKSWIAAALFASVAGLMLSGCCAHRRGAGQEYSGGSDSGTADQPVPSAPVYPRFHPVPTRPVFLPEGMDPAPAEAKLQPTNVPVLSAAPNDGWHAHRATDAISPAI